MTDRTVLYFHGLASSPKGRKIAILRELLAPRGFRVVAPDLNVPSFERLDFEAICAVALDAAARVRPHVLVGSSLGALVALEAVRRGVEAPLVLISPALAFAARWVAKLPPGDSVTLFHHGYARPMQVHRAFFEHASRVEPDRDPPAEPVTIVMGRRDESVPFELVEETWQRWRASGRLADGSEFVSISDGDHGLVEFGPLLADAVAERARRAPTP